MLLNGLTVLASLMVLTLGAAAAPPAGQQAPPAPAETLFRKVRVLDVVNGRLGPGTNVLVRGNVIAAIGPSATAGAPALTIDGQGRTLMPGLIDAHVPHRLRQHAADRPLRSTDDARAVERGGSEVGR
jgi:predicted amidohydrolase YtcJ